MKLLVIGLVFVAAAGALVWVGVVEGSYPVLQIPELKSHPPAGLCRVDEGIVHSVENPGMPLRFTIRSSKGDGDLLRVESEKGPPDNFRVGNAVGVKGVYDPAKGLFLATEVTTQCPSRYGAAKEAAKELQGSALKLDPRLSTIPPEKGP